MADEEADSMAIVHVARCAPSGVPDSAHHWEALMAKSPCVQRCGDVYRALALLLDRRPDGGSFAQEVRAVVVCVDGVHDTEMEFFRLLHAARPAVRLLTYSASALGNDGSMARALSAGAHGAATEQEVRQLLTLSEEPLEKAAAPGSMATAARQDAVPARNSLENNDLSEGRGSVPVKRGAGVDHSLDVSVPALFEDATPIGEDENLVEDAEAEEIEESAVAPDEGAATPRVPWLRYNDQPVRMSPTGRVSPNVPRYGENGAANADRAHVPPVAAPSPPRAGGPPPLLSAEELRALLEDDVSALTPRAEDSRRGEQRPQGW